MSGVGRVIKTMKVGVKRAGDSTVTPYECAVTAVRETPSADVQTSRTACPDGTITDVGPVSWTVNVDYNTDYAPGSFHRLVTDHAGATAELTWEPDATNDPGRVVTHTVVLNPGEANHTVGAYGTASASLPSRARTVTDPPVTP